MPRQLQKPKTTTAKGQKGEKAKLAYKRTVANPPGRSPSGGITKKKKSGATAKNVPTKQKKATKTNGKILKGGAGGKKGAASKETKKKQVRQNDDEDMGEKKKKKRSSSSNLNSLSKVALSAKRDTIVQETDCDPNVVFAQDIALNEREGGTPYLTIVKSGASTKALMKTHEIRRREKGTMYIINLIMQRIMRNCGSGTVASMIADGKLSIHPSSGEGDDKEIKKRCLTRNVINGINTKLGSNRQFFVSPGVAY
jgi:hypothetical protein